jgi:hypothetical protein
MLCFPAVLQVTHKLAALLIQAYQQPGTISQVPLLASFLVGFWIETAYVAINASPGSRAATSVRQQLQDSQLLQHMASCMDAAAALLTAAAAAAVAAAAANSGGSTLGAAGTLQDRISFQRLGCFVNTATCCRCLLLPLDQLCAVRQAGGPTRDVRSPSRIACSTSSRAADHHPLAGLR